MNFVKDNKNRNYNGSPSKPYGKGPHQYKPYGKGPQQYEQQLLVDKDTCLHCKKKWHYKEDCADWLKSIMAKKGIDTVSFVNESLYTQFSKSTWWIDSGAAVHVANSL